MADDVVNTSRALKTIGSDSDEDYSDSMSDGLSQDDNMDGEAKCCEDCPLNQYMWRNSVLAPTKLGAARSRLQPSVQVMRSTCASGYHIKASGTHSIQQYYVEKLPPSFFDLQKSLSKNGGSGHLIFSTSSFCDACLLLCHRPPTL